jgi:hypothetical protein
MHNPRNHESPKAVPFDDPAEAESPFVPSIDMKDVFCRLIEEELRGGRLTRSRRKRIVQYAVQLRISAVETGRLIEACRQRVLESSEPAERYHALRLVERRDTKVPFVFKVSLVVALAILLEVLLLKWPW